MIDSTILPLDGGAARDIFRAILDAYANPGRVEQMGPVPDVHGPPTVWPVLALADIEVALWVGDDVAGGLDAPLLGERLARATGARLAETIAGADMVLLPDGLTVASLDSCRTGTAEQPELGARVVVGCASLGDRSRDEPGTSVWVAGPGAAQGRRIELGAVEPSVVERLSSVNAAYPAGLDVLFVAPDGSLVGIPRSCRIEVVAEVS